MISTGRDRCLWIFALIEKYFFLSSIEQLQGVSCRLQCPRGKVDWLVVVTEEVQILLQFDSVVPKVRNAEAKSWLLIKSLGEGEFFNPHLEHPQVPRAFVVVEKKKIETGGWWNVNQSRRMPTVQHSLLFVLIIVAHLSLQRAEPEEKNVCKLDIQGIRQLNRTAQCKVNKRRPREVRRHM